MSPLPAAAPAEAAAPRGRRERTLRAGVAAGKGGDKDRVGEVCGGRGGGWAPPFLRGGRWLGHICEGAAGVCIGGGDAAAAIATLQRQRWTARQPRSTSTAVRTSVIGGKGCLCGWWHGAWGMSGKHGCSFLTPHDFSRSPVWIVFCAHGPDLCSMPGEWGPARYCTFLLLPPPVVATPLLFAQPLLPTILPVKRMPSSRFSLPPSLDPPPTSPPFRGPTRPTFGGCSCWHPAPAWLHVSEGRRQIGGGRLCHCRVGGSRAEGGGYGLGKRTEKGRGGLRAARRSWRRGDGEGANW